MWRRTAIVVVLTLMPQMLRAQSRPSGESLPARQQALRERMQRLETRMLKLAESLAETEPQKAERLRDGLQLSGKQRLKARLEALVELLHRDKLSDADHEQRKLIADLESLLQRLQSNENELDRRRAERERLEAQKRAIRTLLDDQMRTLQQTQELGAGAPLDAEPTQEIERRQRELERRAEELRREMERDSRDMQKPGARNLEQSAEQMRQAAERLGERDAPAAADAQKKALDQLQQSLNELDDALRQVRREETEETLAALEARFRSMLTREQDIRAAVAELAARQDAGWGRPEQTQLEHALTAQRAVAGDCESTLRLLRDEGTTVIVPELVAALLTDMGAVATRLEASDVSPPTRARVQDVITALEELLEAIETKQAENERDGRQNSDGQGSQAGQRQPLLPGSTELRLLRSSQIRINARTESATIGADGTELTELAQRQRRLAELARRMNERQQ